MCDSPGATVVTMQNFGFHPETLHVRPETRVTWVNCEPAGREAHTSTSDVEGWQSPFMTQGQEFSHTFQDAGRFAGRSTERYLGRDERGLGRENSDLAPAWSELEPPQRRIERPVLAVETVAPREGAVFRVQQRSPRRRRTRRPRRDASRRRRASVTAYDRRCQHSPCTRQRCCPPIRMATFLTS